MKSIYDILSGIGLEVPEEKKAEFDKEWKANYQTKDEYDSAAAKRDEYKNSLDIVNEKLKEFEGINVDELKGQIAKLQDDLKAKDDEYAAKEADRLFTDTLKEAIRNAGGRNDKAVMALLDLEGLKASKNQSEDIKKALETAKESDAYLFGANEPFNNPVGPTGGAGGGTDSLASIRAAMGLPAEKK